MTETRLQEFSRVFRENVDRRSRTAKGVSDTSSSSAKKPLMKTGADLKQQVESNTVRLIDAVWLAGIVTVFPVSTLRKMMESWYDTVNRELQPKDAYAEEYARLEKEAAALADTTGRSYAINRRYRLWNVGYTTRNISPLELELAMDKFYWELSQMIAAAKAGRLSQAELLAFADLEIDGEIHPWADGCGRMATATVMWLSLLKPEWKLPVFGSRDEHYTSIHDLASHTRYYEMCLNR